MTDTTNTTTTIATLPAVVPMREQLPALLEKNVPLLEKWNAKAMALLDSINPINSDEEREDAVAKLSGVRDVYNASVEKRKQMTEIVDAFKDAVMEFERPFDTKAGAKSKYNEKRKFIEDYDQRKLEERRRQEAEAAKRKELENLKVDLRAKILENLTQMLVNVVKRVDTGSKAWFDALTLEKFDKGAESYKGNNPKLKQSDYDGCFIVPDELMSRAKQLFTGGDFSSFVTELQQQETFDKWNISFIEAVSPIINEWRARIPDLKKALQDVEDLRLKDAAAAAELAKKQKEEADRQQQARQEQLDSVAKETKQQIQSDANMDKMSNEFAAQAAVQSLEDAGGIKLVMKFTDPKFTVRAMANIIYHCMAHEKFPGIQKRDKSKKLVTDDKGRPEYIEAVQWWIDFFLKNCDADIEGTKVFEDSKTTIRK